MHYFHNFMTWLSNFKIMRFILKWFVETNLFTLKINSILSVRWPQLGPGLIMGTSHRSAKKVNIPHALKYKGIRCYQIYTTANNRRSGGQNDVQRSLSNGRSGCPAGFGFSC